MNKKPVPVLMYHSVGKVNPLWIWNYLTIPLDIFEDHVTSLYKKGFNTITLDELYFYIKEGRDIPTNSIVFTFDDGYLDNWVYVYPILKKYGYRATIFINPEFVDIASGLRPNIEDVWRGRCRQEELVPFGFLSWEELRIMEQKGVMDIQSHTMSHTWYFKSNVIVDFRCPGDPYVWLDWNDQKEYKYAYMGQRNEGTLKYGQPVYEFRKSLEGKRVYPSKHIDKLAINYVNDRGGAQFFDKQGWKRELFEYVSREQEKYQADYRMESDEDYKERLLYEIVDSKSLIENKLGKKVRFLCWPGGGYCKDAMDIALKNYDAVTLSSKDPMYQVKKNFPGEIPCFIKRIGIPYENKMNKCCYYGGEYLSHFIKEFQGSKINRKIRQMFKLAAIIGICKK